MCPSFLSANNLIIMTTYEVTSVMVQWTGLGMGCVTIYLTVISG